MEEKKTAPVCMTPVTGSEIGLRPEMGPAENKEQLIIITKHKKKNRTCVRHASSRVRDRTEARNGTCRG